MSTKPSVLKPLIRKEVGLFVGLLFFGLVLMPVVVFLIGESLFGTYAGSGYGGFFGMISEKIRNGDRVAWFLVLAPYLIWQILRLMATAWRHLGHAPQRSD